MKKLLSVLLTLAMIVGCFPWLNNETFRIKAEDNPCVISEEMTDEQKDACRLYRQELAQQLEDSEQYIRDINANISEMKANIAAQGQKINEINEKIRTVENQISIVEENVKVTETNIVVVEEKIAEREQKIEDMNNKIKERMAAEQSNVSSNNYIKFIMGATSFVDLFRRISALNEITGYDKQKIDEMEAEKVLLEQDKVELENQKIELEKQKADLERTKDDLETLKERCQELIDEYRRKQAALATELENVKLEMSELKSSIKDIDQALSDFYASNGFYFPIHNSFYISSSCYYYEPGDSYSGFHPAADMAANYGSNVYAVANGYVVATNTGCPYGYLGSYCGYGFGNYICYIVQVGDMVYEIINAHLSSVNVSVGDSLLQGEVIGNLGSSGSSTGPHLHVEVIRMGSGWIRDYIEDYANVGRVYYTLGRNIYSACTYRGAPCYENALNIFGVKYGYWY